jgi:hypothetical protein
MTDHLRCLRCGHFPKDHGPRGGSCNYKHYTKSVTDHGGAYGVEIIEDVRLCECSYLLMGA